MPVAWDADVAPTVYRDTSVPPLLTAEPITYSGYAIRHETFGCICHLNQGVLFGNALADALLTFLLTPRTLNEVTTFMAVRGVDPPTTAAFLQDCRQLSAIAPISEHSSPTVALQFDNRNSSLEIALSTPLSVELEITNKCFRRCTYCAYESGPSPSIPRAQELTTEAWLSFLDTLADAGLYSCEFTGGDPFVRDDLFVLLHKTQHRRVRVKINSDLTGLSDQLLPDLAAFSNLSAIQVSVDGSSPDINDRTRGNGAFKLTLDRVRRLSDAGLPVDVGMTVHSGNYTDVQRVAQVVHAAGARGLYIGPMYAAGRGRSVQSSHFLSMEQWNTAIGAYKAGVRSGDIRPTHHAWYELAKINMNPVADQMYLTSRANESVRVNPRGDVYVSAKFKELGPTFSKAGNITTTDFMTIWQKSPLLNYARSVKSTSHVFDALDIRNVAYLNDMNRLQLQSSV